MSLAVTGIYCRLTIRPLGQCRSSDGIVGAFQEGRGSAFRVEIRHSKFMLSFFFQRNILAYHRDDKLPHAVGTNSRYSIRSSARQAWLLDAVARFLVYCSCCFLLPFDDPVCSGNVVHMTE